MIRLSFATPAIGVCQLGRNTARGLAYRGALGYGSHLFVRVLIIWTISVFFATLPSRAQYSVSMRGFPAILGPGAANPNEPSTGAWLAWAPGGVFSVEAYLGTRRYCLKLNQGAYRNRAGQAAFFGQVYLRMRWYRRKHALALAGGPSWFWAGAAPSASDEGASVYRPHWLSGELEYEYYLNSRWRALAAVQHIAPEAGALSVGLKFFFNAGAKDCNCPSFKKY